MLKASPQEKCKTPRYPSYSSFKPETLRKLPARWQRSKRILLCLGVAGTLMLSGCPENGSYVTGDYYEQVIYQQLYENNNFYRAPYLNNRTEQETYVVNIINQMFVGDHLMGINHGGAGMAPLYVGSFTEREAINIIKREAAAAGLNLAIAEPDRSFEITTRFEAEEDYRTQDVPIILVDSERAIAIAYIHAWAGFVSRWGSRTQSITNIVNEATPEGNEAAIGVFINPRGSGRLTSWEARDFSWGMSNEIWEFITEKKYDLSPEQKRELLWEMYDERMSVYMVEFAAKTFADVEERIALQMNDFIEWLELQGIMD